MLKRIWNKGTKQKIFLSLFLLITLFVLFILRDDYQPALLFVRKYIFMIIIFLIVIIFTFKRIRKAESNLKRILSFVFLVVFFGIVYFIGAKTGMYAYMQKYNIFKNLNLTEITELPTTKNERIQPYNNIVTMAYESIGETDEVSPPQLVRVDGENRWTMAIQPAKEYVWQRVSDNTEEIFSVPSTTAFPRFAGKNREKVVFSIGESLSFSRNTYNATVQKLNFWQYLNLEPEEVFYMKNDQGKWVQVVSLIKWKGFFFPYPTFGGVVVIQSGKHTTKDYFERLLFGKGTYISPNKMKDYPYLKGQNTLSEKVSRLQAESLKFLGGFSDPLPWNMKTSVKIPDLEDDQNQQPFVTDFNFDGINHNFSNGLYHWFGLEPIGEERTSLSYSVFIPSDGNKNVLYYDHAKNKEGFAGVSAMPLKVMESKKEFDWSVNKPVEFRPYIKDIAGKRRMFVLSTIAAKREDSKKFDGSATPDLALIDMEYRDVIWVDVKTPENWNKTIIKQLGSVWKSGEPNNDFFKNENWNATVLIENEMNTSIESSKMIQIDSLGVRKLSVRDKIKALESKRDSLKLIKIQKEIDDLEPKKDTVKN